MVATIVCALMDTKAMASYAQVNTAFVRRELHLIVQLSLIFNTISPTKNSAAVNV